mmetsp:Transcript_36318/g.102612  ORF Transcript_36318/g.102612 Transcript_36318/m.102612 type:complete len:330 (-) Transcript_36318:78-1067(-)
MAGVAIKVDPTPRQAISQQRGLQAGSPCCSPLVGASALHRHQKPIHVNLRGQSSRILGPHRARGGSLRCPALSVEPLQQLAASALASHPGLLVGATCNSVVYLLGIKVLLKGLTPAGVAHSAVLGSTVYAAFGLGGYLLVCLYFIFGSAVTKLKLAQKQAEGIAEARGGRRTPASVWGSGAAGMLCAVAALITTDFDFWQVGFVASFASKLCDTVSSEVGKAYGQITYLSTNFEVVPRGTEGAVSLEGTLAGIMAALLFASISVGFGQVDWQAAGVCTLAAALANYFESCLGATVQGDVPWLTNDVVNALQITLAGAIALAIQGTLVGS